MTTTPLDKLDDGQRDLVRSKVRALLQSSPAYDQLTPEDRRTLANGLVKVVAYLADPEVAAAAGAPTATGLADGVAELKGRLAKDPRRAQQGFKASAGREGAEIYKQLTSAVDFPDFVAGLIDGVFNSIVDASIRQMDAYAQLLAQVSKSVDEFAKDNFTLNQGRDYLAERFPNSLEVQIDQGAARLIPTEAGEDNELAEVRQALGVDGELDLGDEQSEAELARRAQLEMAKLRQKQLATMVLLGINRIVVTDGEINAKVVIDVKTSDKSKAKATASMLDDANVTSQTRAGWFSRTATQTAHKTLVTSASDETSESKAEAKAKLSGSVRVKFKSETFPLERVASQTELDAVNSHSKPAS